MNPASEGAKKLRLFVAFDIPAPHLDALAEALRDLRGTLDAGRWTTPEQQHVTLKFIGWMEPGRLEEVRAICARTAEGARRAELSLTELGAFPTLRRARVLWIGIADRASIAARLAADLDAGLAPLGVEPEGRAYTPHLTLARFKPPQDLRAAQEVALPPFDPFPLAAITLFRSHLARSGPRYEVVDRFALR